MTSNRYLIVTPLLFLAMLCFAPLTSAVQLVDSASVKLTNIEYGQAAGEKLLLDVSVPAGNGAFPVAILVHGGGWTGGDKAGADITPWFDSLTDAQFTWFSINYRLAPQHRWPACLEDVKTAIRWVKANAARYKGDPSRIALIGYSAGGHLATFAATVVDDSVRVQAVVGYAPLTDFVQELPMRGNVLGRAQQGLLNRPKELTPESLSMLRTLSPINYLRPGLPPFLLLHGDADKSVPYEQSLIFQSKLQTNGVPCDLITLPGAPHRLTDWDKFMPDHGARMIAWLRETLGAAATTVGDLRCENCQDPLGIDATHPRLSWILNSTERGQRQTAYQVLVATSVANLNDSKGDLWDSGKVVSDQSTQVPLS